MPHRRATGELAVDEGYKRNRAKARSSANGKARTKVGVDGARLDGWGLVLRQIGQRTPRRRKVWRRILVREGTRPVRLNVQIARDCWHGLRHLWMGRGARSDRVMGVYVS